jgi:hypothetical protein
MDNVEEPFRELAWLPELAKSSTIQVTCSERQRRVVVTMMVVLRPSDPQTAVRGGYRAETKAVAVQCDTRSHPPAPLWRRLRTVPPATEIARPQRPRRRNALSRRRSCRPDRSIRPPSRASRQPERAGHDLLCSPSRRDGGNEAVPALRPPAAMVVTSRACSVTQQVSWSVTSPGWLAGRGATARRCRSAAPRCRMFESGNRNPLCDSGFQCLQRSTQLLAGTVKLAGRDPGEAAAHTAFRDLNRISRSFKHRNGSDRHVRREAVGNVSTQSMIGSPCTAGCSANQPRND